MEPLLIYYIKINIGIILFYGFYKLFFTRDTLFRMRRTALLSFFMIAFLYPLMNLESWIRSYWEVDQTVATYNLMLSEITIEAHAESVPIFSSWEQIVLLVIAIGAGILFIRFLTDLIRIFILKRNSPEIHIQSVNCYQLPENEAPFSFFSWIFINPGAHNETEQQEILTHELSHARQLHSLDVILSELFCMILWVNPFAWLLSREIRQNLEYLADQEVLEAGFNPKNYQYHLLGLTYTKAAAKLYNNFNVLPLKNRIRMMNKKRTNRAFSAKYALFVPLAFALLFVSNIELIAREANNWIGSEPQIIQEEVMAEEINTPAQPAVEETPVQETEQSAVLQKTTPVKETQQAKSQPQGVDDLKGKPASVSIPQDKKVDPRNLTYTVVEHMPKYPGGERALLEYLVNTVKYPAEEAKKGIQGRVIVTFVINKEGKVTDPVITRGVDPALDAEALRVINAMPLWTPGMQRGEPVNVKYTVPINFRLDKDGNPDKSIPERRTMNLIIVDGKEYTRAQFDEMAKGKDPKWIEKVDIMKPVEAVKVYGEKGKEGAIIITTRK